jgi:hypothetical protein
VLEPESQSVRARLQQNGASPFDCATLWLNICFSFFSLYQVVLECQEKLIASIQPGVSTIGQDFQLYSYSQHEVLFRWYDFASGNLISFASGKSDKIYGGTLNSMHFCGIPFFALIARPYKVSVCLLKGIVSWNKIEFWRFHHVAGNFLNSRQRI